MLTGKEMSDLALRACSGGHGNERLASDAGADRSRDRRRGELHAEVRGASAPVEETDGHGADEKQDGGQAVTTEIRIPRAAEQRSPAGDGGAFLFARVESDSSARLAQYGVSRSSA